MLTKNRITEIKSLAQKKNRIELGEFITEGAKMLEEIANSKFDISQIFYTSESEYFINNLNLNKTIDTIKITPNDMGRLSQLKTPTNILTIVKLPNNNKLEPITDNLSIALDAVQDPGNLGTIIRIADWYGIKNIICSETCADAYAPKVIQATMGAITRVNITYTNLERFLSEIELPIYGTFLEGENIYKTNLSENGIIVMGNEGNGISDNIEKLITNKIHIPSFTTNKTTSESLNVAVATAICISEFKRNN